MDQWPCSWRLDGAVQPIVPQEDVSKVGCVAFEIDMK